MTRLLLDTNIYGLMTERKEGVVFQGLVEKAQAIVYGCSVVRKELRDVPKKRKMLTEDGVKNLRIFLLCLYERITKEREIIINEKTQELAEKYGRYFTKLTGIKVIEHLKNDFLLVACASENKLDLVISEDHRTLFSTDAVRAYNFINLQEGLTEMHIVTYEEIKELLKRWSL